MHAPGNTNASRNSIIYWIYPLDIVARPSFILTGSLSRVLLGIWADQYGGRLVFPLTMLASALSTFLLSFADSYGLMLLAALGLGLAGGGFAVGVAYVSHWYPQENQGTALGFFGMGNVGAAVTKFLAPWVMVAMGWTVVAQVWAAALAITAVLFFLFAKDDPSLAARRKSGEKPRPLAEQLEPLRHQQVWRFSLYYFFVFGAFVALALWLPKYLIGVYGVDVKLAGTLAATFSLAASVFRAYPHGAFFIPKGFGSSIATTGSPLAALWTFFAFYASCTMLTWYAYTRKGGLLHEIERGLAVPATRTFPV